MHKSKDRKHILHLPKWYPYPADPQNGVFIRKQIEALGPKFQNSVLFIKSAKQDEIFNIVSIQNDHVETCMVYFREYNGFRLFKQIVHLLRYLSGFKKGLNHLIKTNGKPNVIHAHVLLRTGLLAWYYSRKFGIKFIISEHWSGFMTGAFNKKNLIYRQLSKLVLRKAAKVLVVSDILKQSFLKLGISKMTIEVVPNVVEVRESPIKQVDVKEKKSVVMLSVADLVDDIKKISEVIDVVAELINNYKLEYWIVGDGEDRQHLEDLARSKGLLNTNIKFHGRKTNDEVLQIINQSDFLVMNSVFETFSVVTAEALLAGKPVVATRCGGPEIFVDEKNGILINPGNKSELKEAIMQMIENYNSYDPDELKLGISQRFSSEAVGLKLNSIYDLVFL